MFEVEKKPNDFGVWTTSCRRKLKMLANKISRHENFFATATETGALVSDPARTDCIFSKTSCLPGCASHLHLPLPLKNLGIISPAMSHNTDVRTMEDCFCGTLSES